MPNNNGRLGLDDLLNMDVDRLSNLKVDSPSATERMSLGQGPQTELNRDLAAFSSANTTGDLLKQAPSVNVRRTSSLNLDPVVRGYNSQQLRASAAGVTQYRSRVDIDSLFSQIDPGLVQQITVIDGPYTALHGPGFAFLVADLFMAPRFDRPQAHGSSILGYGSNAGTFYQRQNVLAGGPTWGAYVSYGQRSAGDYLIGGRDAFRIPSAYDKWDGYVSTSVDLGRAARLETSYLHNDINNLLLPGVVYDINDSWYDALNTRYVVQPEEHGPERFVLQYWLDGNTYRGDASRASKQQTLYRDFFSNITPGTPVNTFGQGFSNSQGLRSLYNIGDADGPLWTIGADWRQVHQRYEEHNLDAADMLIYNGNLFGIPDSTQDDVGVFSQFTLPMSEAFSLSVGGRVDQITSRSNAQDAIVTQFNDPSRSYFWPGSDTRHHTMEMLFLSGKLAVAENAWLTAGTAFAMRAPTISELYSDQPYVPAVRFGSSFVDGMSSLDEEEALQFDLGLECVEETFDWGVRAFYSRIHDYILLAPSSITPSPFPANATYVLGRDFSSWPAEFREDLTNGAPNADQAQAGYQYTNIDLATLFGGDLHGGVWLNRRAYLYGTLAYVQGTNFGPVQIRQESPLQIVPLGGSDPLPNIYPLNGTFGMRFVQPRTERWSLEPFGRWAAAQYRVSHTLAERPTQGFLVFGLRGHFSPNQHLRFTMALDNLFDISYREHGSLAIIGPDGLPRFLQEPGFNGWFGVELTY